MSSRRSWARASSSHRSLFAGVLRSLITLLLSKPESTERALGLLTSLAKASGHISMNLVPMYRRLAKRFDFKVSDTRRTRRTASAMTCDSPVGSSSHTIRAAVWLNLEDGNRPNESH
jgi:hypothetical protein